MGPDEPNVSLRERLVHLGESKKCLLQSNGLLWLMDALRRKLLASRARRMQLDTLRLVLIKVGGRVRELLTKVRMHLASRPPGQGSWHALSLAFGSVRE